MLTNLIIIILQTISMSQFTMDSHIDNPIISPAYSSALHKQQAYVKLPSVMSTLQPLSEEIDRVSYSRNDPFTVNEAYERYLANERLKNERDNLFNSIIVLDFFTEEIRSVDILDLHMFTRRTFIYNNYIDESPYIGNTLRELHALDEEYKKTHDELRKKNIISRLEQIRIVLYHHLTGHLNYKRILYAVTLSRIYIYEFRQKVKVAVNRKKRNK